MRLHLLHGFGDLGKVFRFAHRRQQRVRHQKRVIGVSGADCIMKHFEGP